VSAILRFPGLLFAAGVDQLRRLPGARRLGPLLRWLPRLLIVAALILGSLWALEISPQRMSLAELAAGMPKFPQTMINVRVSKRFDPKTVPEVQETVKKVSSRLGDEGRVVLRPSGTEPVIRVMVEARDETDTVRCAEEIAEVVRRVAS